MSKYFVVPLIFFSLSFSFFYDSHIGNDEKTEVDYMEYPPLTGFTDTPKEGRAQLKYNFSLMSPSPITTAYDSAGEKIALLETEKFKGSSNLFMVDYYGYKRSGIKLGVGSTKINYQDNLSVTSAQCADANGSYDDGICTIQDDKLSVISASVYFIWGDKFTFPVHNIKTEAGFSTGLPFFASAIDYKLTDSQLWSSSIRYGGLGAISVSDTAYVAAGALTFKTKLIHNFSELLAISGKYNLDLYTTDILDNGGNTSIVYLNSFEVAAGIQFSRISYGYYDFNLKLIPSFQLPLKGKNIPKSNILSLGIILDFI